MPADHHKSPSRLLLYSLALGAMALAVLLRWVLDPFLGDTLPLATFYGAVAVAVWLGGWRPAALATLVGYVTMRYLFIPPRGGLSMDAQALAGLSACLTSSTLIIILGEAMRRARVSASQAARKVVEQTLAAAEQQARIAAIVESSDDAIISKMPEGIITSFNRAAERIFGYSADEVIGQPVSMLLPPDRADEFPQIMQRLRNGERIENYETVRRCKDGSLVDVSVTISPMRDGQGKLIGASKVARDITLRKHAERRLAVQHAVTRILAEAESLSAAVPQVLRATGEALGWSLGAHWLLDAGAGVLHCAALWRDAARPAPAFTAATRGRVFRPGVGLPGRVWSSGEPAWIEDVVIDGNFPRGAAAAADNLHGAFAFPIMVDGEIVAVMEFFSAAILQPDEHLLREVTSIGRQLGQFIRRKNAEHALHQSEARKAAILHAALDGIITIDHHGRIIEFNPAAEAMFGYQRQDVLGREMAALIIPLAQRAAHRSGLAHFLATGEAKILNQRLELMAVRADGTEFPVEVAITRLAQDGPPVFTGHISDITQRRAAEQALRDSEERFRQVANTVPAVIWTADAGGNRTWVSDRWYAYTGLTAGDDASPLTELVLHPDDRQRCIEQWQAAVREGSEFQIEARRRRHDGEYRWWLTQATPIRDSAGRIESWFGSSTDIHDLKMFEQALHLSQERFASFMRHLPGAAWVKDLSGKYLYVNPEAERIFGKALHELIGFTDQQIFPPQTAAQFQANDQAALAAGSSQIIETLHQGDGVHHSMVNKFVLRGSDNQPEAVGGVAFDVTERMRAEHALRESEERLRLALQAGQAGVWDWDIEHNRVLWSDYLYDLHGVDRETFAATVEAFGELVHPGDKDMVQARLRATLEHDAPYEVEFRAIRPCDGQMRWIATSARVLRDQGRPVRMFGVTTDITHRKGTEAELARYREHLEELVLERTTALEDTHQKLRQSERMAAIGTLSAGIGHDIGNLLMPVRSRVEALQAMGLRPDAKDHLQAIASCAQYLQNLANGLRLFALDPERSDPGEQTDLHAWRSQVEPFFRSALPRNVALQWQLPDDLPRLAIARHALTQAVYNMVQNAGDALRERPDGVVRIAAAPQDAGDAIRLSISDNGPGMTEEVRLHCLEPFFTTKTRSLSTGLGLSLVHNIVSHAGGAVEIESTPGQGTTFVLVLPAVAALPSTGAAAGPPLAALVTIADTRTAAMVESLLNSWRIEMLDPAGSQESECDIWIADARTAEPQRIEVFLNGGPRRWCVVLDNSGAASTLKDIQRATVIPWPGGLSNVNQALGRIVAEAARTSAVLPPSITRAAANRLTNGVSAAAEQGDRTARSSATAPS